MITKSLFHQTSIIKKNGCLGYQEHPHIHGPAKPSWNSWIRESVKRKPHIPPSPWIMAPYQRLCERFSGLIPPPRLPRKWRWNLKNSHSKKKNHPSNPSFLGVHVNFQGCTYYVFVSHLFVQKKTPIDSWLKMRGWKNIAEKLVTRLVFVWNTQVGGEQFGFTKHQESRVDEPPVGSIGLI